MFIIVNDSLVMDHHAQPIPIRIFDHITRPLLWRLFWSLSNGFKNMLVALTTPTLKFFMYL
jgi:hypothetical protein